MRLREIVFEGNTEISDDELADLVKTERYHWWSSWITGSGVVKKELLEQDTRELALYYLNRGYAEVQVGEPTVDRTEEGLRLTYRVQEGALYHLDQITAEGDLVDGSVEQTLEGIEAKSGAVFSVDQLKKDTFSISEKFTDVGYAFANVEPDTRIDRDAHVVDVKFRINKGDPVQVNRINITGNQKTRDNVIRRSLKMTERELFSSSKIRASQQALTRLGFFEEVTISPEPTNTPGEVDLAVGVREAQTGTFSIGAGVSSGEGFLFSGSISERNLFGRGHTLSFNVENGTRNDNFVLSFDNPRVNDTQWSFGADALSVEREFDDFDRKQKGGAITAGYPLYFLGPEHEDEVRFTLKYELLEITIDNVDLDAPDLVKDEEGESTSSSVTPRLVRNTIDNPLNPSEGSRSVLSTEVAGLGGDEEFWLFQASNTLYYPIAETSIGKFVFSQRTRLGYGETFNDEDFPLFRRFFPGGIDSVRGFDSRELGPKDEQGNEFGGSKELIANFEVIFPLISSIGIRGLAFYDVGNAFDDNESIDFSELRHAAGWGIRWSSPLGPIRVEIGYPLDREEGEDPVVTHFSFGAPL